ncbi:hypothetical protein CCHR01_12893, partial [Colletotrichum chrysophilum]
MVTSVVTISVMTPVLAMVAAMVGRLIVSPVHQIAKHPAEATGALVAAVM